MKKKLLFFLICALAVLSAAHFTATAGTGTDCRPHAHAVFAPTTINWGLVHNSKEQPPQIPANAAELLAGNNGIYLGKSDDGEKKVYLTFDMGYEAGHTRAVLDILKENNIKALFFLCGNYLQEEELINRMIDEGHAMGNHTNRHKDLPKLSREKMKKDIVSFNDKFNGRYGEKYAKPVLHFRPPQGRFNEDILKTAAKEGMKTVLWSSAIVDWGKAPINASVYAEKIASRIHPGAIILSHITNPGTPEMLKLLIPKLSEKGYTFGSAGTL